jgi:hypothetical protein
LYATSAAATAVIRLFAHSTPEAATVFLASAALRAASAAPLSVLPCWMPRARALAAAGGRVVGREVGLRGAAAAAGAAVAALPRLLPRLLLVLLLVLLLGVAGTAVPAMLLVLVLVPPLVLVLRR